MRRVHRWERSDPDSSVVAFQKFFAELVDGLVWRAVAVATRSCSVHQTLFFFNLVFTQREIGKRCRSGTDVAGPVGRRLGPPAVLSHPAPYDSCHALSISPVSSWSGDRSGPSISTAQPIARWVCYCTAQIGDRTSRSESDGIGLIRKPTNRLPPASFGWCAAHVLACPLSLLLTPAATTAGSMGSSVPSHVYNEYAWPK